MDEAHEMLALAKRLSNLATRQSQVDTMMLGVAAAIQRGGDFEEAAKRYRHLVDNGDPETVPLAAFSLGVVSQSLRRPADARAAYEIAMDDRWPNPSAKAAFNLGLRNQQEGNLHESARCFSRAIEIDDPEVTPVASRSLGEVLHKLGDREGSVRAYERAHNNADGDAQAAAETTISRALALIGAESYPEALDFLYDVMTGPVKGPAARAAAMGALVAVTTDDVERQEAFLSHMFRLCGVQQVNDVMTALGYGEGETAPDPQG